MITAQSVLRKIPATIDPGMALMVYGSEARGEAGPNSDLDLLRVVHSARRLEQHGRAQVSSYTMAQLAELGQKGSLFFLHLITDGIVVWDPEGLFAGLEELYRKPESYEFLFADLRAVVDLINVNGRTYHSAALRFDRILVFAARSYVYACAANTSPCFSLPRLAERGCVLARTIVAFRAGDSGFEGYQQVLSSLNHALGHSLGTPHPSMEVATRSADLSSNMVCRFVSDLSAELAPGTNYTWLGR